MHLFQKSQYNQFLYEACRINRDVPGTEICGLIVDTGHHLSFVQTRNTSTRSGSFVLSRLDVRKIASAVKVLGQEIIGTFHSHPVAEAIHGKSDVRHAVDDSLMFIFDCIAREGRLWKIKNGKARPLDFGFVQSGRKLR